MGGEMRKVYLKLKRDDDIHVEGHTNSNGLHYWHLCNQDNEMSVVRHGFLCKSIVRGVYILDTGSSFLRNKLLTRHDHINVN